MAVQPFYAIGTATVTNGSAIVTGTGTAWSIGVVNGGEFSLQGFSIPIASVNSNNSLTLAYPWPHGSVTAPYAISLGNAGAASAIAANERLAQFVAAMSEISPFARQLFDDADAAAARATLGAAAPLGYVPVQQGTGVGQGGSTVKVGWKTNNLGLTVDTSDLGNFWGDWVAAASNTANGYQRFPNGLFLQWGMSAQTPADYVQTFPIAFPNACLSVVACTNFDGMAGDAFIGVAATQVTASQFVIRKRVIQGGSVTSVNYEYPITWLAVGY
jgi:hypothetical protein